MEGTKKGYPIGKVHRKMYNMDLNEINSRTSYNKYHNEKSLSRADQNSQGLNDNLSEKSNSIQTSYQYRKKYNENNTLSSKCTIDCQNNEGLSVSLSDNDNLICPDCINCVLVEEKKKRDYSDKDYNNSDGFLQDNNGYEQKYIEEKRRQREHNTNEAIKNLQKIKAGLTSKDKLIQSNENSRNPLSDGLPDYQYQKFKDEYSRKQKMINDNINKYYPQSINERPEIASYYNNYVYNNKNSYDREAKYNNETNKNYGEKLPNDKNIEYLKSLEEQINYKNELKRREKEEDKKREQQQYEALKEEMKREEEEKNLKEKKQKEEIIKANNELINKKNKNKMKELEEKLKYKEYYDKENEEYKKELIKQKIENERKKKDMCNDNKNEYNNGFNKKHDYYNNKNDDKYNEHHIQKNEKMGRCCRCHRIFPRKLLTINRYFYKENRK
jgi:hypothetical protein